jgi:hypothetical protein
VKLFLDNDAIRQTPVAPDDLQLSKRLHEEFTLLLGNPRKRLQLGRNALAVMRESNGRGAETTVELIRQAIAA